MKLNGTVTIKIADYDKVKEVLDSVEEIIADRNKFALMVIQDHCSWWFDWNEEEDQVVLKWYYVDEFKELNLPDSVVEEYKAMRKASIMSLRESDGVGKLTGVDLVVNSKGETNE